jgi:putative N6-adenine-specific DNA methylase
LTVDFFVTTSRGLEDCLGQEIFDLGGRDLETVPGGVSLTGEPEFLTRLNLQLTTALRVLLPLKEGICRNGKDLYRLVKSVDWSSYLDCDGTLAVHCVGRGSEGLRHTRYAALRVKDGIVDQFRDRFGRRPNVDRERPDLSVHLHLRDDQALLSLDSSCDSLHRRGYRLKGGDASLRETLAAGLVRYTEWDRCSPFVDLMCGSGTLVIEAARWALGLAPGDQRNHFGYWGWKQCDKRSPLPTQQDHERILTELPRTKEEDMPVLLGFDHDSKMIEIAKENAERAGVAKFISFEQRSLEKTLELPDPGDYGVLICNPPYGERLGEVSELSELYQTIGDVYKRQGEGYRGFVLAGNTALAKSIGLRTKRRRPIWNGPIECRFLTYELYSGTKKRKLKSS